MAPQIYDCKLHEHKIVSSRQKRHVDVKYHKLCDAIDGGRELCKAHSFGGIRYRWSHKGVRYEGIRKANEITSDLSVMDSDGG